MSPIELFWTAKKLKQNKKKRSLLNFGYDDDDDNSWLQAKAPLTFEFIQGEYFQSTRILIKHWRYLQKNKQRTTIESESENYKSEFNNQNF